MSQLFTSRGQSIGASVSVLPMNIQDWFPSGLAGMISLQSKVLSRVFSSTTVRKHQFFSTQTFLMIQLSHWYMTTRKTMTLARWIFVNKVISLLFNVLSRFGIAFLPRIKLFVISWLQSLSAAILEPKKINSVTVSTVSPSICMKWWGWMPWSSFLTWVLSQLFHSLFFHLHWEVI